MANRTHQELPTQSKRFFPVSQSRLVLLAQAALLALCLIGLGAAPSTAAEKDKSARGMAPGLKLVQSQLVHSTAAPDTPSKSSTKNAAFVQKIPAESATAKNVAYVRKTQGMLAIVIDDIGHNLAQVENFLALPGTLNYAVLPDVRKAPHAAKMIHKAGMEFIIHLPMQPIDYPKHNPGVYPLLLSHGLRETRLRMEEYMARLPGFIGASNHMGSAYSYKRSHMGLVQKIMEERGKFFLNSKTSPATEPREIAHKHNYRYLERDVFLDHDSSVAAVRKQLRTAVKMARRKGSAIAIGHPYDSTLKVLRENMKQLRKQGITLVPLSSLLTH